MREEERLEAFKRLGVTVRPMEDIGTRDSDQNRNEVGNGGEEEAPSENPEEKVPSGNPNYIDEILAAEREEMEGSWTILSNEA